jgi:hypothetical protein
MKKLFFTLVAMMAMASGMYAQGKFEVKDFVTFKMHTYFTNDPMGDTAFIIETEHGLVTLDEPLMKDNFEEFNKYMKDLHKPVDYHIINFHEGGNPTNATVRAEGMTKFMSEGMYDNMMKGFQQSFGDKMLDRPIGKTTEIRFGETLNNDGVTYKFEKAPAGGFPAATIIIGGKVRATHSVPAKAHINGRSGDAAAIEASMKDAEAALVSGCELFIGSHGGYATKDVVEFQADYYKKVLELAKQEKDADAFVTALKKAYPGLAGEDGLTQAAANLYK